MTENTSSRYIQLTLLVLAAGSLYPLIYLRQNFELSLLEALNISATQLGQSYSMLGLLFVVSYLPSGWLADRIAPKILVTVSLLGTGVLGLWFSTMPSASQLTLIFAGWGITSGLTFWAAIIKAVAVLGRPEEQGRFFGLLDGGRGLVEAILATIAVAVFAYFFETVGEPVGYSLTRVIWFYVSFMFILAPIVYLLVDDVREPIDQARDGSSDMSLWADIKFILSKPEILLCAFCILTGYQLFWATYSFSAYLQETYSLTAVAVGSITVAKLWMRPIGAAAAGFAGDFFQCEKVLAVLLLAASLALSLLVLVPVGVSQWLLLSVVLMIGLLTYGVRGIYWATLESSNISPKIKGLAIGLISLIGYTPDIYLPLINGALVEAYPGKTGYGIYYSGLSLFGLLGVAAALMLSRRVGAKQTIQNSQKS